MKKIFFLIFASVFLNAQPLNGNIKTISLFKEPIWEDIDGKTKTLASIITDKGLVVISYTECKTLCPTITSMVKSIFEKLEANGKKYEVIFLSIDPQADTLGNRKKHFEKFSIDSKRWHFLKTDLIKTKEVAHSLGFSFGEKRNNEHTMHSSRLALVNSTGEVLKTIDLTSDDMDAIVKSLDK